MWLTNRPKHLVPEHPNDSPEVWLCSPFIVPSLYSMRDPHDIILGCHDHLLRIQQENHCACALDPPWFICISAGIHARTPNTVKALNLFISFLIPFQCLWHIYIYIYIYYIIYIYIYIYIYTHNLVFKELYNYIKLLKWLIYTKTYGSAEDIYIYKIILVVVYYYCHLFKIKKVEVTIPVHALYRCGYLYIQHYSGSYIIITIICLN